MVRDAMDDMEKLAYTLYTSYCDAVDWVAFNNEPLPIWDDFIADPAKARQAEGWRAVARTAVEAMGFVKIRR